MIERIQQLEEQSPNAFNQALVLAVQRDGRTFLSSTSIDGVFMLRVAVLSFRTHLEQIDTTIEILKEKVRELESGEVATGGAR